MRSELEPRVSHLPALRIRELTQFSSFGIFRLTDPGGLQVILSCEAKEAFHPHPEVPIYTVSPPLSCIMPSIELFPRTVIIIMYK